MRVKGQRDGDPSGLMGGPGHSADEVLVAPVHPVKRPNGDVRRCGEIQGFQVVGEFHRQSQDVPDTSKSAWHVTIARSYVRARDKARATASWGVST